MCLIWFTLSQSSLYLLCLILKIKIKLSQINYSETRKIKGQRVFIYYGQIYVDFGSVIVGCHCIGLKDDTLIELHTMNNNLTWFTLSQISDHVHFVSNHYYNHFVSNDHETKWIWQLVWDKVNMIISMRQSEYDK